MGVIATRSVSIAGAGLGQGTSVSGRGRSLTALSTASTGRGQVSATGCSVGRGHVNRSGSTSRNVLERVVGPWSKGSPTSMQFPYNITPGPTSSSVNSSSTSIDLFYRVFSPDVWELMVEETNRYASFVTGPTPSARPWTGTNAEEMKAFIGIIILMGILKLPRLELCWSHQFPEIESPGISKVMTLVRFEQLFRYCHLSNNNNQIPCGQPGYNKLYKIRPLLDIIVPHFKKEYNIHKECSIDEAMIPFKGRLAFKQYIKDKPTKWGIKVFVLADSCNPYVKIFKYVVAKDWKVTTQI